MGTMFEELVRRFNEENNEEAGEHFTRRDVVKLMAKLFFLPMADHIESGTEWHCRLPFSLVRAHRGPCARCAWFVGGCPAISDGRVRTGLGGETRLGLGSVLGETRLGPRCQAGPGWVHVFSHIRRRLA